MENYTRSKVIQTDDKMPLDTHSNCIHMKVLNGSKIRNLLGFALKKIREDDVRQITWNAQGDAISKAISCAEIMKKKIKKLHQTTNIRFVRTEEYWEPKREGLERLKVNKDIPAVTVLLSKDELDTNDPSYQPPGVTQLFCAKSASKTEPDSQSTRKKAKPFSGNKKSPFTPPSMDRKRKRKGDGYQSGKSDRNDGQSKTLSKDRRTKNTEVSEESRKANIDEHHASHSEGADGNTQKTGAQSDDTKHTEEPCIKEKS